MEIRTVFLDIGQVMVGLDFEAVLQRVQAVSSLSPDQVRSRLAACPELLQYETGRLSTAEFVDRFCSLFSIQISPEEFRDAWGSIFLRESPHVISSAAFSRLKERLQVVALSNTNEMHFEYLRSGWPIINGFHDYVLSYQVGSAKPEPAIYKIALEKVGAAPQEVLFVDDRPENIEAAQAMGIRSFLYTDETALKRDLESQGYMFL